MVGRVRRNYGAGFRGRATGRAAGVPVRARETGSRRRRSLDGFFHRAINYLMEYSIIVPPRSGSAKSPPVGGDSAAQRASVTLRIVHLLGYLSGALILGVCE